MKILYLLRHAKSEWDDPELDDFDRPLNKRGHRNAGRMATYLQENNIHPDLILCSAAKRAVETCGYFVKDGYSVQYEDNLYLASSDTLADFIHRVDDRYNSAMVVAHNPGLEEFTLKYGRDGNPELWQQVNFKYPTAAIAQLEIESPNWSGFTESNTRLINFVRPKDLSEDKMADSSV